MFLNVYYFIFLFIEDAFIIVYDMLIFQPQLFNYCFFQNLVINGNASNFISRPYLSRQRVFLVETNQGTEILLNDI